MKQLLIKDQAQYQAAYRQSVEDPEGFWAEIAGEFEWHKPWDKVLEWNFSEPKIQWFKGAQLNITVNCLDRHLEKRGDKVAILWEPNDPTETVRRITYRALYHEVCRMANALKAMGIGKGDRICFYMPMVPELAIGLLACARIGAVHSVVFAGFSANALADRVHDSACKMVICADYNKRGPKQIPVKSVVDEALAMGCPTVSHVLVYKNTGSPVNWVEGRDVWMHDVIEDQPDTCPAEMMDSEDMLFILYTSGSTGKPKGVVHTIGGYMVFAWYTFMQVFQYDEPDIYCCTADIGWITGHTYILYGPLLAGATTMLFEGVPTYPDPSRFWQIIEKHKVNQFYTAPTAIRALMAQGDQWVQGHDFSSLKVLGSVGEPINEEAWHWYHNLIGRGKIPIVDTWWQTETGGIMISPIPNVSPQKPGYAMTPLPGVQLCLVDPSGNLLEGNDVEGLLCISFPWPGMLRTTFGNHERCRTTYFSVYPDLYFSGDGAHRDADGTYRIIGRVDDVLKISGHRIGTAEVENVINAHPLVVESAVVGYPHPIKGQGIYAYVITREVVHNQDTFRQEVNEIVTRKLGPIARPDIIQVVSGLPKTRSGKIMRRILRKIAAADISDLGDTSTLLNPEIVEEIRRGASKS
ncbi:MAG: acetate--CoA ligase [Saprospiraceae bacterium]|nr:acetate--CoA ligase [Saprospiraceae bacterium]